MRVNFIICDDQEAALNSTTKYMERAINENDIEGKIVLSSKKPEEVLEYSKTHCDATNVYILDINFNEDINGLGVARNIRQREPNAYIIFITAHVQLSMMTFRYKLKAFDFLIKPISWSDINECIGALHEDLTRMEEFKKPSSSSFISVTSGYQEYQLLTDEIVFIESFGPKLIIHMVDGKIETYSTLKEMQQILNKTKQTFHRVHKSYLINMKYVKEVNLHDMQITMSNGEKCPISRAKKEFFKKR